MAESFVQKFRDFYFYTLPYPLWRIANPLLGPVFWKIRLGAFEKGLVFHLFRVTGRELLSGESMVCSVFGTELEANYYGKLLCGDDYKVSEEKKDLDYGLVFGLAEKEREKADIVIVRDVESKLGKYRSKGFFSVPDQVEQEIRVPKDQAEMCRVIKKALDRFELFDTPDKFSSEVSKSEKDFDLFYGEYYIPTVKKRFEDAGFIFSRGELKKYFDHGALIFLKECETRVGASLVNYIRGDLVAVVSGLKGGDTNLGRLGYKPLMLVKSIEHARALGFKKIGLGQSRPFLTGGVLVFKKKVGGSVKKCESVPLINSLYFNPDSKAAFFALQNNAMLLLSKKGLVSFAWINSPLPEAAEVVHARRVCKVKGAGLSIIAAQKFSEDVRKQMAYDKELVLLEASKSGLAGKLNALL